MTVDIDLLLSVKSTDEKVRNAAITTIQQLPKHEYRRHLLSMSQELSNDEKPLETRLSAGTVLNLLLDATTNWVSIDISDKNIIKGSLLGTLASSHSEAGHIAAKLIGRIASIEIPNKEWPGLFCCLHENMSQEAPLKQTTLEALGYICENMSHYDSILTQDDVNHVLKTVVLHNSFTEQSSVSLAAVTTLYNVLRFAHEKFKIEVDNNIMEVVCGTAMSQEANIRKVAFECMVFIASTYYHVLDPYMEKLFTLTTNAFKDEETVALQAINFWSSICEEEIKFTPNSHNHLHFIEDVEAVLIPALLETILKQAMKDEDKKNEDSFLNLFMKVGECLGLVARVVGDSVLSLIIPFVKENLTKGDWRSSVAGAYAFVSILEGPSVEQLSPKVSLVIKWLLFGIKGQDSNVKCTTAWALNCLFRFLHRSGTGFPVISPADLKIVIQSLLVNIQISPQDVAQSACGVIFYLAQGYEGHKSGSSGLTDHLDEIIKATITAYDRTTGIKDKKLQSAACAALKEVVRCSNLSLSSTTILKLLDTVIDRIKKIHKVKNRKKLDYQLSLLCGVLLVIIRKLGSTDETKPYIVLSADEIMGLLNKNLSMLELHPSVKIATYSCCGDMALAIGNAFEKYVGVVMSSMQVDMELYAKTDVNDEKKVQYGNEIKMSTFEAYLGICQMLKKSGSMLPHAEQLLKFSEVAVKIAHSDESEKAALPTDVANALGPDISIFCLKKNS